MIINPFQVYLFCKKKKKKKKKLKLIIYDNILIKYNITKFEQ
jgi:hypothetical protein